MARFTYEKEVTVSRIFNLEMTRWIVRDANGRKQGTIALANGVYEVTAGHYDMNDNLLSCANGCACQTYRQAQRYFQ